MFPLLMFFFDQFIQNLLSSLAIYLDEKLSNSQEYKLNCFSNSFNVSKCLSGFRLKKRIILGS